jgi:iron complex outermembrane receptor protein
MRDITQYQIPMSRGRATSITMAKWSLRAAASASAMLMAILPGTAFAQNAGTPDDDSVQQVDPMQRNGRLPGAIKPSLPLDLGKKDKDAAKGIPGQKDFSGSASDVAASNAGLFLGFSTINGREISGAGNTRVNDFKQFPGDLFHTDFVQRFADAGDIEGALFGTLEMSTIHPLELKKSRFQAELRSAYYPYADRAHQGLGDRISASYVDQFNTGIGRIGISVGFMRRDLPQPREYYESGTNYKPCNSVDPGTATGMAPTTGVCSYNAKPGNPLYLASGTATYRQERVEEKIQGYNGQLEWQPNDRLDFNLDVEHSHRNVSRYRGQLDLTDVWSGIDPLAIGPNGELQQWKGNTGLELTSFKRTRDEMYTSVGWNGRWQASDRFTLDGDASFQRTHRVQTDISTTLDANNTIGPGGLIPYTITESDSGFSSVDFGKPVDLNNYSIFTDNPALRRGLQTSVDRIWALRLDGTYKLEGFFTALKMGLRYSDHIRNTDLKTFALGSAGIPASRLADGSANCRIGSIVNGFGTEAGTNINSWAEFDPTCMFDTLAGTTDPNTTLASVTGGGIRAHEQIVAGYVMADFASTIGNTKFDGNVGVRVVGTSTSTRVYKYDGKAADLAGVGDQTGVIDVLPSAHVAFGPAPGFTIRAGIERALLRSNIEGFGLRRILQGTLADSDRPHPLLSWNADLNLEYRADRDTSFLLGLNYKLLNSSVWPGDALIPGGPVLTPWLIAASKRGSYIRGFEVGVNRTFHSLPAPFDGLSFRASYAFYDSNFTFRDPTATDPANPLYLFTDPAGVPGLAKHNIAASTEYTYKRLHLGLRYEFDTGFFRPTGFTANRYRSENQYLNANMAFTLTDHFELLFTASNLTNQPEQYMRPNVDSTGQTPYTGRVFTGAVRVRY